MSTRPWRTANARERERAWEAAFARAEAAEAREKGQGGRRSRRRRGRRGDVPADGRRDSKGAFRKRARETVRLASQGEGILP